MACLPLVLVDGEVLAKGDYPSRAAIATRLGLAEGQSSAAAKPASSACCAPAPAKAASGCCGPASTRPLDAAE
jgi:hypothetical protein